MDCRVKPGNDDWAADVLYSASEQQDRREDVMGSKTAAMVACLAALLAQGGAVRAADVSVIASTAMREVLEELVPMFERASGHKVTLSFLSGAVLPVKVKEGAQADLVVTAPQTIDDLVKAGRVEAGTRVDFVRSGAGVAVRAGVRKPDIATPDAFKNALLAAKTVGYSQGPSGVHFMTVLARLGIADQIKAKGVVPPLGQRVGTLIAKGEAEIGVQQITELLLIPGIDFVGPLPKELQANIVYATATPSNAKERQAAAALVKFLSSEPALPVIKKMGLEPG
jgi:molybdate transport system substrate-binding protein